MPEFDVLVIGGGAAGLRAAIAAKQAGASVGLLSKVHPLRTNTGVAQGGLNAPLAPDDSAERFADDILVAGDGLCEPEVVKVFTEEARKDVIWLERMGAPFNRDAEGRLDRRWFGSNRLPRTVYADDWTGHVALQVLHEQSLRFQIASFEEWFVTSLLIEDGACFGALAVGLRSGRLDAFVAPAVILATGGFTAAYAPSTAAPGAAGDGHYLAYRAGARLMDMEMVQFHPTVYPGGPGLLITEAALSEGGQLVDAKGSALDIKGLPRHAMCLAMRGAPRDSEGALKLDLTGIDRERLRARLPQTCEMVRGVAGIDLASAPVPVSPAAHRSVGGIETDANGLTSVPGLFAAGECAANGLNGAGRLAGNTLTEALVFGRRAGEAAAAFAREAARAGSAQARLRDEEHRLSQLTGQSESADTPGKIRGELGRLMDEKVGLVREAGRLQEALAEIRALKDRYTKLRIRNSSRVYNYDLTSYFEVGAMLAVAEMVAVAAQERTESRGSHQRSDFPNRDDANWAAHTVISQVGGQPQVSRRPIGAGGQPATGQRRR